MKKRILLLIPILLSALLLLTACNKNDLAPKSAEAEINKSGKKITVTVVPDLEELEKYDGSRVYLFALEPGRDVSEIINGDVEPVKDKRAKKTVTFKLDALDDDGNSRLYFGFIAAFFDRAVNKFVPITDTVCYVKNPEILSKNDTDYPEQASLKGVNAEYDGDTVSLDVSHVIIDIPIDEYAALTKSESVKYERNGKARYINESALTELDRRVKYYSDENIAVYFRITLNSPKSALPEGLSFLACDGSEPGLTHYPINVSDVRCAEYLSDFLDFMAERYTDKEGTYGLVSAFIAGNGLNTPGDGAGTLSYDAYFESCTVLTRIMYTAMASHFENGRVFLSVDKNYTVSGYGACDVSAKKFLSDFSNNAKASGDYPWGVALSTTSTSSDSDRIWYDNAGGGKYITPVNLTTLTDTLLSSEDYRYGGEMRHIIISDFSVALSDSDAAEQNQAASIAYAYYKAVAAGKIDAFFYSSEVDKNGIKNGLRAADENGTPIGIRPAFSLYSLIDSDADLDSYIGTAMKSDSDWDKLYADELDSAAVVKRRTGKGSAHIFSQNSDPTDSYKFNTLFDLDSDSEHGFTAVGKGAALDTENDDALSLKLNGTVTSDIGHTVCKNIKKSKLSNDSLLITASLGGGKTDVYTVTLTLIQKNDKKGDTVYVSSVSGISGGAEVLLDFDISEFRRELSSGKLEMRLSAYSEGDADPSCELSVSRILVGKAKTNAPLIILLTVLAVTAVTLMIVLSVVWFRRNYKLERTPKTDGPSEQKPKKQKNKQ